MKNVLFLDSLPEPWLIEKRFKKKLCFCLIFDQRLASLNQFNSWMKKFDFIYAVKGDESIKDLEFFHSHLEDIFKLVGDKKRDELCFVSFGGGALGDFVGFVASVFKRGSLLVHIPSTWISALDSSHGGKTALNLKNIKNQIGSFFPAHFIYIVKDVLSSNPNSLVKNSCGEFLKMALIDGPSSFKLFLEKKDLKEIYFKSLKRLIKRKYKIIKNDFYDLKSRRAVLNLGHSFGHLLEAKLNIPHGWAVAQGLWFSFLFSKRKKILKKSSEKKIESALSFYSEFQKDVYGESLKIDKEEKLKEILSFDKKTSNDRLVDFIFIESIGKTKIKKVSLEDLMEEIKLQGWIQ